MANDTFDDVFVVVMETSFPKYDELDSFRKYIEKEILAVVNSREEGRKHVKLYSDQLTRAFDSDGFCWTRKVINDGSIIDIIDGEETDEYRKRYRFGLKKYKMNEINTEMES